jgi:hypothetical protein
MQVQKDGLSDVCETKSEVKKKKKNAWRWWAKALGEKASKCDKESDNVAIIRTIIFATYLITNCFIVAGVIRQWDRETKVIIQIKEPTYGTQVVR